MPRAWSLIRTEPHYRREAFDAGLRRLGFQVISGPPTDPRPGDLVLVWNRMAAGQRAAVLAERAGATVLVAENGYLGADREGRQLYALAEGHHNGRGRWPDGGPERWEALGLPLQPWRADGRHILVLAQRGIGEPGIAAPRDWARKTVNALARLTRRPVVVREHPGRLSAPRPLAEQLEGCWCALTWSSGAGLKALLAGVPVIHALPGWIGAAASGSDLAAIEAPAMPDRMPMLRRLAWAQWTVEELASGEAVDCLLSTARQAQGL